jgi:protein-S-isoprenylcysteine O-methyltransferase Ste14
MTKTLLQMLGMWAVFLWLLPRLAVALERRTPLRRLRFESSRSRAVGRLMFVAGYTLAQWSAVTLVRQGNGTPLPLDSPRDLVIEGPYRHVRNPMAMGSLFQGLAVGANHGSPLVLAYVFIGALVWDQLARPWEEAYLERRFGDRYRDYRAAVRCWIPRLTPFRESETPVAPA